MKLHLNSWPLQLSSVLTAADLGDIWGLEVSPSRMKSEGHHWYLLESAHSIF